jgi:hypothetical protein
MVHDGTLSLELVRDDDPMHIVKLTRESDGDGIESHGEWLAGTNPTVPDGTAISVEMTVQLVSGRLELSVLLPEGWTGLPLTQEHSTDLNAWSDLTSDFGTSERRLPGQLLQRTYTSLSDPFRSVKGFYRIVTTTSK